MELIAGDGFEPSTLWVMCMGRHIILSALISQDMDPDCTGSQAVVLISPQETDNPLRLTPSWSVACVLSPFQIVGIVTWQFNVMPAQIFSMTRAAYIFFAHPGQFSCQLIQTVSLKPSCLECCSSLL